MPWDASEVETKVHLRVAILESSKGLLLSSLRQCKHDSRRREFHLDSESTRRGKPPLRDLPDLPSSAGTKFLRHEIVLVSDRVIFQRPKYPVPEFFVKWSCLKTEGVKERICAAAFDRVGFGTLHQFPAKALSSHRHGHREDSHVQPSSPNISEQTAQYLAVFILEKESDRIPISVPGTCDVVIDDNRLHEVVHLGGGIGIEYYSNVAHKNGGKVDG
jgi:hypothetical protein